MKSKEEHILSIKENHSPIFNHSKFVYRMPIIDENAAKKNRISKWFRRNKGIIYSQLFMGGFTLIYVFISFANHNLEEMMTYPIPLVAAMIHIAMTLMVCGLDVITNPLNYKINPKDTDFCRQILLGEIAKNKDKLDEFMKPYGLSSEDAERMARYCRFRFCYTDYQYPLDINKKVTEAINKGEDYSDILLKVYKIAAFTGAFAIKDNLQPIIFMDIKWIIDSAIKGKLVDLFQQILIHEFCHVITPEREEEHHGPLFGKLMEIFGQKASDDIDKNLLGE